MVKDTPRTCAPPCDTVRRAFGAFLAVALLLGGVSAASGVALSDQPPPRTTERPWTFTVSGASSDCGNLVMPAIARAARDLGARFHWHLGGFRRVQNIDTDFLFEHQFQQPTAVPTFGDYRQLLLSDVIEHQVAAFRDVPLYVTLGGTDDERPSSRLQYRVALRKQLTNPAITQRRAVEASGKVDTGALPPSYYHWREGVVDFLSVDDAGAGVIDARQLRWLDEVIARAGDDTQVRTVVVGLHAPLPYSRVPGSAMCATSEGVRSGEHLYRALVALQDRGKHVYIVSAQGHYVLSDLYETGHWIHDGDAPKILPGWNAGTAGAEKEPLPEGIATGPSARSGDYGVLVGTVAPDGTIDFVFHEVTPDALTAIEPTLGLEAGLAAYCAEKNVRPTPSPTTSLCPASTELVAPAP